MAIVDSWDLLVRRDDPTAVEIREVSRPALEPGEVRLEVEKFGMTMNTVTYVRLGYGHLPFLQAFPAAEGYDHIPVWAFLRVAESRNDDVAVGGRFYGFVPAATHHTVAARPTSRGFVDTAAHREFLPAWYRTFQSVPEPGDSAVDDARAVYRQIFPAAFHLADFVAARHQEGAKSALITSASSRSAIALATLLAERGDVPTIGLTSASRVEFVRGLGVYDTVATYDELDAVSVVAPAVLAEFTGVHALVERIYQRFPGELARAAMVGFTHPEMVQQPPALTDPEPEIFFTPMVEEQTVAVEGEDAFFVRYHETEQRFLESTAAWLTVARLRGPAAIADAFRALLTGSQPAGESYVLSP